MALGRDIPAPVGLLGQKRFGRATSNVHFISEVDFLLLPTITIFIRIVPDTYIHCQF
jgi:hypothetical protein